MSCKSAIYTAMTSPTTILPDGTLPLGTVIRRFGNNCQLSGSGITIDGIGYYEVSVSVTAEATSADDITVVMLKDGVEVPGANASATAGAVGDFVTLSFPALVRLSCCNTSSTLTFALGDVGATVDNVALTVKKI